MASPLKKAVGTYKGALMVKQIGSGEVDNYL